MYEAQIKEINAGYSKGEDGKEDKSRPRLEVIYEITDPKAKTKGNDGGSALGARIWDYVTFSASTKWKLAQFTRAFAGADKSKPSGEFDTAKLAEKITDIDKNGKKTTKETGHAGAKCKLRVRADSDQEGNYRAKVASILPLVKSDDDAGETVVVDDDNEEMAEESTEEGYSESDLKALSVAELKEVVKSFIEAGYELDIKGKKKSEVITMILEAQAAAVGESDGEGEELIDDDEEMVDDEVEEEESSGYSEDDLKAMSTDDLKEAAKTLGVMIKGKKKSEVISAILEAQSSSDVADDSASSGDDDDLPF